VKPANQLAGFVELQRLLDQRSRFRLQRETPPALLLQYREQFAERQVAMAGCQQRQGELRREQRAVQLEADTLREEQEHFRKQKTMVTNMKQLTAVVSALDNVQSQLKTREDRLLAIWQELEALEQEAATLEQEGPEERVAREAAEEEWRLRQEELDITLGEVERELRMVQRRLGPDAMERFKKLWVSRKPHAVVPLDGTSCSYCHAELRPSLVQQVRTEDEFQHCDSCRRLLYDPARHPAP